MFSPYVARHLERLDHLQAGGALDWPIQPLGVFGRLMVLRDATGTARGVPVSGLTRRGMLGLFAGDAMALCRLFPREAGRGWSAEHASEAIIVACGAAGIIDPGSVGLVPVYRQVRAGAPRRVMLLPCPPTTQKGA